MTQFEAVVEYAGKRVKVTSDTFEEMHQTLAGIEELNRDAAFLEKRGIDDIIPVYRRDQDENEYFGLQDRHSRKNVTFGKKRGEDVIPFFPKGSDGYYNPDAQGRRSPGYGNGHRRSDSHDASQHRPRPRPPQRDARGSNGQGPPSGHSHRAGGDLPF